MLLALSTAAIVLLALLWELSRPKLRDTLAQWHRQRKAAGRGAAQLNYDPGRERRAEQRARELLRSCVNDEEWGMYRDLGFMRVWGRLGERPGADAHAMAGAPYAYLVYPHKPIVAYLPQTGVLLNEYCVAFPDHTRPYGSARLPDSDDVLAKWMALTADEHQLIADANMHLPGRQIDPEQIRRDLARLSRWERERLERAQRGAGSVPAS
ncbi:MAG TPA: hypothetical protein VLJ42_13885 [Solirubrobacteraceae bacterium]|nr:hypothetical protein [Solirubrobacteraceae bacterium]